MDVIIERTYTADEFETLPFDGNHYELVDGRIIEKMSPGDEHGWISRIIFRELTLFDPQEKLGSMWPSTSFKLSENTTPIPDLAFVVKSRIPNPRSKKAVQVVPDFVVEVWSPGDLQSKGATEAAIIKIRIYLAAGVKLIWVVNPRDKVVDVYHTLGQEPTRLTINDTIDAGNIIPGFSLTIKSLFE